MKSYLAALFLLIGTDALNLMTLDIVGLR